MKLDTEWLWDGLQRHTTWPAGMFITVDFDNSFITIYQELHGTRERWNDPDNLIDEEGWEYYYMESGQFITSVTKPRTVQLTPINTNNQSLLHQIEGESYE